MPGYYDTQLVILSVIVATLASYTTLELAGRVSQREGTGSRVWLLGGALSMGTGIWSMHFIGMLAFHLPVPVAYDTGLTMLSMAIAIAVSGVALNLVRRTNLSGGNIIAGGTLMGLGISAMHYTGMYAMQMWPAIHYVPILFVLSVIVAIVASSAAIWIAFRLRHKSFGVAVLAKLGSAAVMGLAITGMHYTAMGAANFAPGSVCLALDSAVRLEAGVLAAVVGVSSISILVATLGVSALDAYFADTVRLASSLQSVNEQLRNLAHYDALTALPNRLLLDDRMTHAAALAARSRKSIALLFVDLDRFKPVNDTFGHGIGDELLRGVARRLSACVRKTDTVARTGGDEFVIVLCEIDQPHDAAVVSGKILDELSRPFFIESHELGISCSIGIALYPRDGTELYQLKANADAAMYRAKQQGRNTYCFFESGMDVAVQRQ